MSDDDIADDLWYNHPDDFGSIHGSTHYTVVEDGCRSVAYVLAFDNGCEVADHKQKAAVITAAPEMLKALEAVIEAEEVRGALWRQCKDAVDSARRLA